MFQFIQLLQCVLDIVPSDKFLKERFCSSQYGREIGSGGKLTCSLLPHLLRHDSKHGQHFRHDLSHHIRHRLGLWDFCVGLEAYEEVFDFIKEFDKRVSARSCVPRRLRETVLLWRTQWD